MNLLRLVAALTIALLASSAARADEPATKIGDRVGKLAFKDIRALPRTLDDFGAKKVYVLVFTNTSCPVAQRYLPVLQALEKEYRDKGVQFVGVNADETDTILAMATHAVKFEVEFPCVKDFGGVCAKSLGVRRTPEVAVLDGEKVLRYRGRIDDQYRLGGVKKEATARELKDAIDALLAGRKVAVAETEVDGCPITFPTAKKPREVNFAEHIAPILQKHCWECHKAGGSGPFELVTYKQVAGRAKSVAEVVTDQRMPPWFASHEFGPFVNRRGLSDEERAVIADWVRVGVPEGDAAKAPKPPAPATEKWVIGEPDLVLTTAEFELPAAGDVPYKYAILPHAFAEDTWVQGIQITTDNPRAVHHANLAYGSFETGFKDANFITGYVPGGEAVNLDDGIAVRIEKGSLLVLQIHFVATGKPEKAKLSVGLRFPRAVVQKQLRNLQVYDTKFAIPPGAPAHKVSATRTLDSDVICVGMFAHMHLRGRDMTFTAIPPGGKRETLVIIPNYNFEWQLPYRWEPGKKTLAKGTKLEVVAHFDNSGFNPYNPDPRATVRNGQQTYNEMMYGFFFYLHADEKLNLRVDPKTGRAVSK